MTDQVQAFLAPVPKEHLESAEHDFGPKILFFGSDDYEFFKGDRVVAGADVYIYESHGERAKSVITWQAEFVRFVLKEDMSVADALLRPSSTQDDTSFVGYWAVKSLRRVEETPISSLHGSDRHNFPRGLIPRRPTAVT